MCGKCLRRVEMAEVEAWRHVLLLQGTLWSVGTPGPRQPSPVGYREPGHLMEAQTAPRDRSGPACRGIGLCACRKCRPWAGHRGGRGAELDPEGEGTVRVHLQLCLHLKDLSLMEGTKAFSSAKLLFSRQNRDKNIRTVYCCC